MLLVTLVILSRSSRHHDRLFSGITVVSFEKESPLATSGTGVGCPLLGLDLVLVGVIAGVATFGKIDTQMEVGVVALARCIGRRYCVA